MLDRRDFKVIKHLAASREGAMNLGIVLVRSRKSGSKVIEKRVEDGMVVVGDAQKEVRLMQRCRHRSIPTLLGYDFDMRPGYASIYMEYCELGSLDALTKRFASKATRFPEAFLWSILLDVSLALCYLQSGRDVLKKAKQGRPLERHEKKSGWEEIVHCDIKPSNMFLTWRDSISQYPTVVLGDFGCAIGESRRHRAGHQMDAFTIVFAPPESPEYSGTSDIYSLALSVHCAALLRDKPYSDIRRVRRDPLGDGVAGYSTSLENLLRRMLNKDIMRRPDSFYVPYLIWRELNASYGERNKSAVAPLPEWAFN